MLHCCLLVCFVLCFGCQLSVLSCVPVKQGNPPYFRLKACLTSTFSFISQMNRLCSPRFDEDTTTASTLTRTRWMTSGMNQFISSNHRRSFREPFVGLTNPGCTPHRFKIQQTSFNPVKTLYSIGLVVKFYSD